MPSTFDKPSLMTSSKNRMLSPFDTSAPAIRPVTPYAFSSFLTITQGRFRLQAMLGTIKAPLSSMEANLSILSVALI
jgi:hypothetical protein